jgi:guanylate kinase
MNAPSSKGRGDLLILSAPSGSGKTTLAYALVEKLPDVVFSRSTTTRPPRDGETNGVDYDFVDDAAFDRMAEEGRFLEWAHVLQHRYGTPEAFVDEVVAKGQDVILNIDIQGALAVRSRRPDSVLIFVLPPSFEELKRRLLLRSRTGSSNARNRLETGIQEIEALPEFDYVVINDSLEEALGTLQAIVTARRARRERMQRGIEPILDTFRDAARSGFEVE